MLWLKKLLKPKWVMEELCTGCMNWSCGDCGRMVSDCYYFRTHEQAMEAAIRWVSQGFDPEDGDYQVGFEFDGETIVVIGLYKDDDGVWNECNLGAIVYERRY